MNIKKSIILINIMFSQVFACQVVIRNLNKVDGKPFKYQDVELRSPDQAVIQISIPKKGEETITPITTTLKSGLNIYASEKNKDGLYDFTFLAGFPEKKCKKFGKVTKIEIEFSNDIDRHSLPGIQKTNYAPYSPVHGGREFVSRVRVVEK